MISADKKSSSLGKKFASSSDIVTSYLTALKTIPTLKHVDIVELFQQYESGKNTNTIRKKLVESNLRLVIAIAKNFRGYNIPIEDLIQEGNIGLMKAIERFDWKRGFRFSTYATWWIKQSIGQFVREQKRTIRLPAHAATIQRKLLNATKEYRSLMGCEPSVEELTDIVGASDKVVRATLYAGYDTISLSQQYSTDGETLEDKIEDESEGTNPFENVASKQLMLIVKQVLTELSPKESAILRLRFGLTEDETNHEQFPISEEELSDLKKGISLK